MDDARHWGQVHLLPLLRALLLRLRRIPYNQKSITSQNTVSLQFQAHSEYGPANQEKHSQPAAAQGAQPWDMHDGCMVRAGRTPTSHLPQQDL